MRNHCCNIRHENNLKGLGHTDTKLIFFLCPLVELFFLHIAEVFTDTICIEEKGYTLLRLQGAH